MPEEEEREKLAKIIQQWNNNRLDLFEISQPDEVSRRQPRGGGRNHLFTPGFTCGRRLFSWKLDLKTTSVIIYSTDLMLFNVSTHICDTSTSQLNIKQMKLD